MDCIFDVSLEERSRRCRSIGRDCILETLFESLADFIRGLIDDLRFLISCRTKSLSTSGRFETDMMELKILRVCDEKQREIR